MQIICIREEFFWYNWIICIKNSFFLIGSFLFCSRCALNFSRFIYCLSRYSWLSVFNQVSYYIDLTMNIFFLLFWVYVSSLFVPFKVSPRWHLLGFFYYIRMLFSRYLVFSELLVSPMELHVFLLVWSVCFLLLLLLRSFHILHLE